MRGPRENIADSNQSSYLEEGGRGRGERREKDWVKSSIRMGSLSSFEVPIQLIKSVTIVT